MADFSKNDKYKDLKSDRERLERSDADSVRDDLIDDEDAIERLLMDNAFDRFDHEKEDDDFAEIDELINEHFANGQDSPVEEFADDIERTMASIPLENSENELGNELDELIEIDEFDDFPSDVYENDSVLESTHDDQDRNGESLMSDFDISAADTEDKSVKDSELAGTVRNSNFRSEDGQRDQECRKETQQNSEILAALNSKLSVLQDDQKQIWQLLEGMEAKDFSVRLVNEVDDVYDELQKIQSKLATIDQKKSILIYAGLAIAVTALLIGIGLGVTSMSSDSGNEDLQFAVTGLEEKVDALMTKNKGRDGVASVNNRLDRMDVEMAAFSAQIASLNNSLVSAEGEEDRTKTVERIAQLEEQNNKMSASLDALKRQVNQLEKKKSAPTKKSSTTKPVASKEEWKVNLVSFRQEWYAKRKSSEFSRQGVPAVVTKAVVDGETWYRLQVTGFENKTEANDYAGKVKKTLNLTSVWVTKD